MQRARPDDYLAVSTPSGEAKAYIPPALPPDPAIDWTPALRTKFDQALFALGRLDSVSALLPETALFLPMYIRKEAALSSMISGTRCAVSDLLLFELEQRPGAPLDDVQDVSNYVAAIQQGLEELDSGEGFTTDLIKALHATLIAHGRGSRHTPGRFRREQTWLGGPRLANATYVPPPVDALDRCMESFERFLADEPEPKPVLLKAALAHGQFEMIRPFAEGNGRIGRLLITLLLCAHGVLREPTLYLSYYFKLHRTEYEAALDAVRREGDWETWLSFFADAVLASANHAVMTAQRLLDLADADRARIGALGRPAESALQVHQALLELPVASAGWLVERTGITAATVNKALGHLIKLKIVKEITALRRNRLFRYTTYGDIIDEGLVEPRRRRAYRTRSSPTHPQSSPEITAETPASDLSAE